MTEIEWGTAIDPSPMLAFVVHTLDDRKRRLFGCACCRRVWGELTDARSRAAVEAAERYAEGELTESELEVAANEADSAWSMTEFDPAIDGLYSYAAAAYNVAIDHGRWGETSALEPPEGIIREASPDPSAESVAQCELLRDIFNPFWMGVRHEAWLTETVLGLARNIATLGTFERLPVLADALEDAGCDDAELLDHCRSTAPHVRGCWVIDLILARQ